MGSPYLDREPREFSATLFSLLDNVDQAEAMLRAMRVTLMVVKEQLRRENNRTRGQLGDAIGTAEEAIDYAIEDVDAAIGVADRERRDLIASGGTH